MLRPRPSALLLLAAALSFGACATSGDGSGGSSSRNVIGPEDLQAVPTQSAYEVVQRLRPQWLRGRGGEDPVVYMDGARIGGVERLRDFRAADLREIRHLSGGDATTRYGTGYGGGTIEMFSRR